MAMLGKSSRQKPPPSKKDRLRQKPNDDGARASSLEDFRKLHRNGQAESWRCSQGLSPRGRKRGIPPKVVDHPSEFCMIIADSRDPSVRAGLALSLRLGMIASKRFECNLEPVDQQNTGEAKLGEP